MSASCISNIRRHGQPRCYARCHFHTPVSTDISLFVIREESYFNYSIVTVPSKLILTDCVSGKTNPHPWGSNVDVFPDGHFESIFFPLFEIPLEDVPNLYNINNIIENSSLNFLLTFYEWTFLTEIVYLISEGTLGEIIMRIAICLGSVHSYTHVMAS